MLTVKSCIYTTLLRYENEHQIIKWPTLWPCRAILLNDDYRCCISMYSKRIYRNLMFTTFVFGFGWFQVRQESKDFKSIFRARS